MKISLNLSGFEKDDTSSEEFIDRMDIEDPGSANFNKNSDRGGNDSNHHWYKKKLVISKDLRCKEKKSGKILINSSGEKVLDAFLNGKKIELTQARPGFMAVWNLPSEYIFDQDLVDWDNENELVVHTMPGSK